MEEQHIAPGIDIIGFEDGEDMLAWFVEQREAVQSRTVAAEQYAVSYNSYCVRFIDELVIFLHVLPIADGDEDEYVVEMIETKNRDENLLWCEGASTQCVDPELGYVHRSVVWPLSERVYLTAKSVGWHVGSLPDWAYAEVDAAYRAIAALHA